MKRISSCIFFLVAFSLPVGNSLMGQLAFQKTLSNMTQSHFNNILGYEIENVVVTPSGLIVAGSTPAGNNKLFLAKLDNSGNFISGTSYDLVSSGINPGYTFDEYPRTLKPTQDGGYLVGGTMQYYYAPTGWINRGFVMKVDAQLNYLWAIDLTPAYTSQRHVTDINLLSNGNYLVNLYAYGNHCAGCTQQNWAEYRFIVNSNGATANRWSSSLCSGFGAVYQKANGELWFAGQEGGNCGSLEYICMRWATPGASSFTGKTYYQGMSGGPYLQGRPSSITRMRDNRSFLVSGMQSDGSGITPFVMKTDSMGTPIWTKKVIITGLNGTTNLMFKSMQLPDSTIVLAGDSLVIRLTSSGSFISAGGVGATIIDLVKSNNDTPMLLTNISSSTTGLILLDSTGSTCSESTPPAISVFNFNIVSGNNYTSSSSTASQGFDIATPSSQVTAASVTSISCESFPPCTIAASFTPSNTEFCVGDTLYVSNTSTGAATYEWYLDGNLTSTQQTPSFPMNVAGTRQVLLVVQNGICVDSFLTAVTTFPIPSPALSASGTVSFCEGDTVQLHATSAGGTLQWYEGTVAIAGATGSMLVIDSAGVYSVVETSTQGCVGSSSNQLTVTVNPNPVAGYTFSTNNGTVAFTNTSSGGSASSWTFGDGNISTTSSPAHTYAVSGTYTVCLTETSQNGCEDTVCQSVQVIIVGFVDGNAISISVAPNPVRDEVMVRLSQSLTEDASITVTDLAGKQVLTGRIASGESQEKIQLKGVGKGIYLLVVRGGGLDQTIKLIVE